MPTTNRAMKILGQVPMNGAIRLRLSAIPTIGGRHHYRMPVQAVDFHVNPALRTSCLSETAGYSRL